MKAMASGTIQATVMPEASRASVRAGSDCARPHSATVIAESAQATAMVRYLPVRSAIGPMTRRAVAWVKA
jgi:hypothetical protein